MNIPFLSPFRTTWGRYFLAQMLKVFFLFLFCFYGLYVLIDFTSHATHFHHQAIQWREVGLYYLGDFSKRLEVLIPFALLISTIKVLLNLNIHCELVALMASGIPLRALLRPFLLVAGVAVLLLYANSEWLVPKAMNALKQIEETHHRQKTQALKIPNVQHIILEDGSTLLFQHFDSTRQLFINAYWIRSMDDVLHIEALNPYSEVPLGIDVDIFKRAPNGQLEHESSYQTRLFPEMHFNNERLMETLTPAEELPLMTLWEKQPQGVVPKSEKEAQMISIFYYKMALPWLALLAVIAPAPFCIRFNREQPIFMIYAFAIFGLVAFYLMMDAALLFGKRQLLPPWVAIGVPIALFFAIFSVRFWRGCLRS